LTRPVTLASSVDDIANKGAGHRSPTEAAIDGTTQAIHRPSSQHRGKSVNVKGMMLHNRILCAMSASDRAMLHPELEAVTLKTWQVIEKPNQRIAHVYFLTAGLASVVGTTHPEQRIEVGMVGFEGMTGLAVALGHDRSSNETVIQAEARALRLPSPVLRRAMRTSPTVTAVILRYVHVFMMQASQTALANGRGRLNVRLARWLLMWQDRLRTTHLTVTHEFLALLLGVTRQGVTLALHELEGQGLIKGTRNLVRILDLSGLMSLAGGFYGSSEAEQAPRKRKRRTAPVS
jgi:CRP-like cAMP-binding protein